MDALHNFLITPRLARNIINTGRGWNLLLSIVIVGAGALCLAFFANANGYRYAGMLVADGRHDIFISILNSLCISFGIWIVFTVSVAVRRAILFNRPVGMDIEAQCFSLPFAFIAPGILLIKVFTSTMSPQFILYYGNALIVCLLANLLVIGHLLITEKGNLKSLSSASSRENARFFKMRMLGYRHCNSLVLLVIGIIIVTGSGSFGYFDALSTMFNIDSIARVMICTTLSLFIWIIATWVTGRYRAHSIGDAHGMKIAAFAVGWSVARFYIIVNAAFVLREFVNRTQPVSDNGLDIIIKIVILVAMVVFSADLLLTTSSVLILSTRYAPMIAINTDTLGVLTDNAHPESLTQNGFEAVLKAIGETDLPSWKTVFASMWGLVAMNTNKLSKQDITGSSAKSLAIRFVGICMIPIAAMIHGIAISRYQKPVFGHYVNISTFGVDCIAGVASCTIYIVLMIFVLYALAWFLKEKLSFPSICALVGFSLIPLSLAMLVCTFLPEMIRIQASELIYPIAVFWAFGFIVLYIILISMHRRRTLVVLPALIVTIVLTHLLANQLIWKAHMCLLDVVNVPVVKIRERIADETPRNSRDDVLYAANRLENVDLVSLRASDLIRHVLYAKKVSRRFYGYMPDEMLQFRISYEVTNGKWMQVLYYRMAEVTRNAKKPDDAARLVFNWIRGTITKVEPVTFPLGKKFYQDPITTLRCRQGNQMDAAILMVAALRASGVAARIPEININDYTTGAYYLVEYFNGEQWKPCYPSFGRPAGQKHPVSSKDKAALLTWISKAPGNTKITFYLFSDGLWIYNHNNDARSLSPGTYLASYVTGNTCHMKQFVLRPDR